MTVKEMCAKYNLVFQTIYKKAQRHKDRELAGHITKVKGSSMELDDFAVEFLLPQYVKNRQIDAETAKIKSENHALNSRLQNAEHELAKVEQMKNDLEELTAKYNALKSDYSNACRNADSNSGIISEYEEKIQTLESELSRKSKETDNLRQENRKYSSDIYSLKSKNSEYYKELSENNVTIYNLKKQIEELTASCKDKDSIIQRLTAENEELKSSKKFFGRK